jgi:DNA helicase-2/ATP-dependent DNA helicase PcrA
MTIPSCFLMELPREEMELVNFGPSESLVASSLDAEPYTEEELSALDQSQGEYEEPVARRIEPAGTVKSPPFLQMTTAAELANGGAPLAPVSPEDFIQGGLVRHPQYGLGRTVALSGSGLERQATVEFPPPAGQMKLLLANSQLRPVTQVIGGKE